MRYVILALKQQEELIALLGLVPVPLPPQSTQTDC